MNARSQMLTMIHSMSKEDLVVLAAAAGDANIVRQCLRQYPDQVRLIFNAAILILVTELRST